MIFILFLSVVFCCTNCLIASNYPLVGPEHHSSHQYLNGLNPRNADNAALQRQIQQWQIAVALPPGIQLPPGVQQPPGVQLPPPAQGGVAPGNVPPPSSVWIQIPGYYPYPGQAIYPGPPYPAPELISPEMETQTEGNELENENSSTTELPKTPEIETSSEIDVEVSSESSTSDSSSLGTTTEEAASTTLEPSEGSSLPEEETPSEPVNLLSLCEKPRGQFKTIRCDSFVNCWDETAIEQKCPAGLLFSENGNCDFPDNVDCGERINETPQPPFGPDKCPFVYGTYRNPLNCSEFIVCADRMPMKFSCPEGLNYNDRLGVCDFPYRVDCAGSVDTSLQTIEIIDDPVQTLNDFLRFNGPNGPIIYKMYKKYRTQPVPF